MKRFFISFFCILFTAAAVSQAQVVPSATGRGLSVTVGAMGSVFQPDFKGYWTVKDNQYIPTAEASDWALIGVGAYVDVKFTRWIQIEAEARFSRFNQYANIHQDNYLIGPRIPIRRFGRFTPYAKALVGITSMDMGPNPNCDTFPCTVDDPTGTFFSAAYGGGIDVKLTRRFTLRAVDAEYQQIPSWYGSSASPYGASVGVSYKIF
jgi:opacity protein-like surface antigen